MLYNFPFKKWIVALVPALAVLEPLENWKNTLYIPFTQSKTMLELIFTYWRNKLPVPYFMWAIVHAMTGPLVVSIAYINIWNRTLSIATATKISVKYALISADCTIQLESAVC